MLIATSCAPARGIMVRRVPRPRVRAGEVDVTTVSQSGSPADAPDYGDELVEALDEAVTEHHPIADPDLPADRFIDREASWLDFNMRVLELAANPEVPLLERVKFLAIFATNLDEFFMVRVAGLKRRIATGIAVTAPSGLSARDQLELVSTRAHALASEHARVFFDEIRPELGDRGIHLLRWDDLDDADHAQLRTFFSESVYPVLTPLAVDPAHPFPYISGLSLNLAVVVRDETSGEEHFARIKVLPLLPRFVATDEADARFIPLETVIAANLDVVFTVSRGMN